LEDSDDGIPVRLHIISGKSNKSNDRIVSNVSAVEDPSEVHPSLRGLYLEYEKIKSLYNSQFPDVNHPKLINFFLKHRHSLNDTPLYLMKEKFSFRRTDLKNILVADELVDITLKVKSNKAQHIIEAFINIGGNSIPISKFDGFFNMVFVMYGGILYLIPDVRISKMLFLLKERPLLKYSAKAKDSFIEQLKALSKIANVIPADDSIEIAEEILTPEQMILELSESGDHLIVQPKVKYQGGLMYIPGLDKTSITGTDQLIRATRDKSYENEYIQLLLNFDDEWKVQKHLGFYYKHLDSVVNTPWIFGLYALCKEADVKIEGYENLETLNYNPNQANVNISLSSGIDWFEGDLDVSYGDQQVELKELRNAILANETTVRLLDGTKGLLPEEYHRFIV